MATAIQISEETKNKLDYLKDYPKESYEKIIEKIVNIAAEEDLELSEETKMEIEQARKEFRAGKSVSFEEVKKKTGFL